MNGTQELKVAVAQFTVRREPEWNLDIIDGYAWQAADAGARLLVLPEGLIARDGDDDGGSLGGVVGFRAARTFAGALGLRVDQAAFLRPSADQHEDADPDPLH